MVKFIESELILLKKEIDEMWTLVYNQLDRAGEAVLTLDKVKQLAEYLDAYHVNQGYMISFNFNQKKEIGVHEMLIDDNTVIEALL